MSNAAVRATRTLEDADTVLAHDTGQETLAAGRDRAHAPTAVAAALLDARDDGPTRAAFRAGFANTVFAMLQAFPENLFWDLDFLAAEVLRGARAQPDVAAAVAQRWAAVADLQGMFGRGGPIRFRYIHDFIFGFDWARWVAKDPGGRRNFGPAGPEFVHRMRRRGAELQVQIAAGGDEKYPPLVGAQSRNPFGFSREPAAERGLHRALASRGELPVAAWCVDGPARWDAPFEAFRERAAAQLAPAVRPGGSNPPVGTAGT